MRYLTFTFLLFAALTSGCVTATSSSQQTSVSETVPTATPKPTFDQAAIEKLNENLPEDVRQILEQAENFEIISPKGIGFGKQKADGEIIAVGEQWRFTVAGKTQVIDSAVRTELLDALYSSIIEAKPNSRVACFYPRHAIRATKQGKTVELVICFDCHVALGNSPNGKIGALVTKSQKETFNRIYTSAGLEIQP